MGSRRDSSARVRRGETQVPSPAWRWGPAAVGGRVKGGADDGTGRVDAGEGVFKQFGVTEFAAEDERVESASTFVSYSTKASPAIEISKEGRRRAVRAFHLELPEGCGVVYLD